MEFYKPYPFLYKGEPTSNKITVGFLVYLPGDKRLASPTITTETGTNTTILTYGLNEQSGSPHTQEVNLPIDWDGNRATVEIIIGSGSGATGGKARVHTSDFE